jgi:hypothetical protein
VFADSPYASAPFSATGRPYSFIESGIAEAAAVSETTGAAAVFIPLNSESAVAADISEISLAVFNSTLSEASTGSEVIDALMTFSGVVEESSVGTDSALVVASTFGATTSEGAEAIATILVSTAIIATITEGAVAADQLTRRLLWELIDDSQSVSWQIINTQD